MKHFFNSRIRAILIAAVLLALILTVISSLTGFSLPDMVVKGVLTPIRTGVSQLTDQAEQFYSYMFEYETILAENERLKEELAQIEAGQYAAICIWNDYVPDALLVPSGAVLKKADGKYVYVDQNGSRVERMVKTGKSTDGLVQILEGLEEGEVVYVKD